MLIVENDRAAVEEDLRAGRLRCPVCGGELRPWAKVSRRMVRHAEREENFEPRRSICRDCRSTHVLLPDVCLAGRLDSAEVIARALSAKARGRGHALIARTLDRPVSTVRGWLRRFGAMAERIRSHMTIWAVFLDASLGAIEPAGSPFADALEASALAARAASLRLRRRHPSSWMARLSAGGLLSNTNRPWPTPL